MKLLEPVEVSVLTGLRIYILRWGFTYSNPWFILNCTFAFLVITIPGNHVMQVSDHFQFVYTCPLPLRSQHPMTSEAYSHIEGGDKYAGHSARFSTEYPSPPRLLFQVSSGSASVLLAPYSEHQPSRVILLLCYQSLWGFIMCSFYIPKYHSIL